MTHKQPVNYQTYVKNISQSCMSIYEPIEVVDSNLWLPLPVLEALLQGGLKGMSLHGLPLRTRSKVVKQAICGILGYPVPKSFKRTRPQFSGQKFDVYIQKSKNLQIWNDKISPTPRYVVISVSPNNVIEKVKVVTGDRLALLDKTGTLTQKYQAGFVMGQKTIDIITSDDTDHLKAVLQGGSYPTHFENSPIEPPTTETLLPIREIFERLAPLVGQVFPDVGHDQERKRGALLHRMVCQTLGYEHYQDDGRFPDIRHQLLEIKLQTSSTIDLGLVRPDSQEPLDIPQIEAQQIRHCDVRYAIFYAQTDGKEVQLSHFYLTTGEAFFGRFPQFQGKVVNKKLQIPLPSDFFDQ